MILSPRLDDALARLSTAIHRLQAAAERRAAADAQRGDHDRELALLQDDRGRLALELDAALARKAKLVAAQAEVFQRLERASRTVEHVMQSIDPAGLPAATAPTSEGAH